MVNFIKNYYSIYGRCSGRSGRRCCAPCPLCPGSSVSSSLRRRASYLYLCRTLAHAPPTQPDRRGVGRAPGRDTAAPPRAPGPAPHAAGAAPRRPHPRDTSPPSPPSPPPVAGDGSMLTARPSGRRAALATTTSRKNFPPSCSERSLGCSRPPMASLLR